MVHNERCLVGHIGIGVKALDNQVTLVGIARNAARCCQYNELMIYLESGGHIERLGIVLYCAPQPEKFPV